MFTAVAHKNLADAESYFDEHLAQNDYYAAGEIRPGQWIGAGAERLGLKENVTRDQFHALCENQNPNDGERLTQRSQKEGQRRVFYDFTCSAPKSVSVLAVTLDDQRLIEAHVLRTSDRITGLRGLAGSGKTTALRELVAACNEAKIEPLFCAPTAAATDVLRKEGFEAKTLQSLLLTKPVLSARQLVVLDEAGAVGMDGGGGGHAATGLSPNHFAARPSFLETVPPAYRAATNLVAWPVWSTHRAYKL